MNSLTLSSGRSIPCLGYGCYNAFGEEITRAVEAALRAGYRYIDSAEYYKNEPEVGPAIGAFSGNREELFILSKAWPSSFAHMEAACTRSIRNLQADYLDAYLLHWPGTNTDRRLAAYEQLLHLAEKGLVRSPGVSNFTIEQLEQIRAEFGSYPVIQEIECHPSFRPAEMIRWCQERGIQVVSYEPINRGRDLNLPAVTALAEKYGRTPAQIVLRWHVQRDQLPIPKSSREERILENISVFDFELLPEELAMIDREDTGVRSGLDPSVFPPGF